MTRKSFQNTENSWKKAKFFLNTLWFDMIKDIGHIITVAEM